MASLDLPKRSKHCALSCLALALVASLLFAVHLSGKSWSRAPDVLRTLGRQSHAGLRRSPEQPRPGRPSTAANTTTSTAVPQPPIFTAARSEADEEAQLAADWRASHHLAERQTTPPPSPPLSLRPATTMTRPPAPPSQPAATTGPGPKDGSFDPSYEWQDVKDGQSVPPGLEITMDLGGKKGRAGSKGGTAGKGASPDKASGKRARISDPWRLQLWLPSPARRFYRGDVGRSTTVGELCGRIMAMLGERGLAGASPPVYLVVKSTGQVLPPTQTVEEARVFHRSVDDDLEAVIGGGEQVHERRRGLLARTMRVAQAAAYPSSSSASLASPSRAAVTPALPNGRRLARLLRRRLSWY